MVTIIKNRAKINSKLNKLIVVISYVFSLLLVLSFISRFINPEGFWVVSFIGLAFPVFFFINLTLVIYYLINSPKKAIVLIISILISLPLSFNYFNVISSSENTENSIEVMSFNCNNFDLYNFENNHISRDKYYNFIQNENIEIICFQEFFTSKDTSLFNHRDSLKDLLDMDIHFEKTKYLRGLDSYGVATFSKYSIINKGKIVFEPESDNICLFTDVLINFDTVRIYNAHLQSLQVVDVKTIYSNKPESVKKSKELYNLKRRLKRTKEAFIKRASQAELIYNHIKNCKYKVILCGDFNDTPSSFAYNRISNILEDSFLEKGFGIGSTYNGKIPFQRIDYIFHSDNINCTSFDTKSFSLSDHFPIVGNYNLNIE